MTEWTAPKLLRECEAADATRDRIIDTLKDRLERYYGTAYGYTEGQYWPENYYFTWVSYILPQIIFQNPRVKIGSLRTSEITNEIIALELAMNRWIKDTDQRTVLRQLGFDMGFAYGVSFTSAEPAPGSGQDVPWRPTVKRLNQNLYSMDPLADGPWDARYQQHISIETREEMLEWVTERPDQGWNRKAIEEAGEVDEATITKSNAQGVPDRGQIAYRTIWCPGDNEQYLKKGDDPESYNGVIYTLALFPSQQKELEWLRPPRAAFVPRWGPYTVFGAHPVPGSPYPLGSLVAVDSQLQELNALALANYKAARGRKRIGIYDEGSSADAAKFAKCDDGGTVGIANFDQSKFKEVELGGVTETGLTQEERARIMVDRATGLNDVQKGGAAEGQLATTILQAVAASNVRTADLSEQFTAAVKRQYTTACWYMWKLDKISIPLSMEDTDALRQGMAKNGVPPELIDHVLPPGTTVRWSGKDNKAPFDALELDIEPYSMKRTDEPLMQQRAMQALTIATQIAPLIPQTPHMRWKQILDKLGDSMNWPGFSDILDEQKAAAMTAMMMQQQQAGSETQPTPRPQPRLGGDIAPSAQGFPKPSGAPKPMQAAKPMKVGAA